MLNFGSWVVSVAEVGSHMLVLRYFSSSILCFYGSLLPSVCQMLFSSRVVVWKLLKISFLFKNCCFYTLRYALSLSLSVLMFLIIFKFFREITLIQRKWINPVEDFLHLIKRIEKSFFFVSEDNCAWKFVFVCIFILLIFILFLSYLITKVWRLSLLHSTRLWT